ncbi:LysR substrate-binding domain-containing protein [Microvirga mediterraneensis]|uniref:LysR family transcriptional regulator n=1 Tax=Microvirga mediterraneensis TaxID=2754695 RepID=A0A838BMB5_9HYPH|nr:LysR substrate-binding domain-containing protein [Microvirga mediterraneensis]MBA1156598.1 LysR family transcriptional regulator [Microvirga mediterraneensis]
MSTRRHLPVLSSLRAVEAAGRHLSFSRAAQELLITQSAVSHHVRKVEEDLGVSLFVRQARSITLTPYGAKLLPYLSQALDLMAKGAEEIRRSGRRTLRVSLLASFATHWLIPRLARFTELHPDIDLILEPSTRTVDFGSEQIDLAIRYGRGGWGGTQARKFLTESISPVCSPSFAKPGGIPVEPKDLSKYPLLLSFSNAPFEWQIWSERAGVDLNAARSLMLHDYNIVIQAALDGQGIAMGRHNLIADHLRRGALVEFCNDSRVSEEIGYWIVLPEHPKHQAKVFAHWLTTEAIASMHE